MGPSLTWHEMNSAKSNYCLEHASKQLEFRITSRLSPHCCSNEINIAAVSGSTQSSLQKNATRQLIVCMSLICLCFSLTARQFVYISQWYILNFVLGVMEQR